MTILPRSREDLAATLRGLIISEYTAAVFLGAAAMFMMSMAIGSLFSDYDFKLPPLLFAAAIGALIVFLWARRYWRRRLGEMSASFLKLDDTHLEIKGHVGCALMHVRFRIDEILDVQLGSLSIMNLLHPLVAFGNATSLFVQEKNGKTIRFNLVGLSYQNEDLLRFLEALKLSMSKNANQRGLQASPPLDSI